MLYFYRIRYIVYKGESLRSIYTSAEQVDELLLESRRSFGAPAASVTGIARTAATSDRQSRIVFVAWYDSRYGSELLLPSAVVGSWGVGSSVVRGQFNCGMAASQRKELALFRLAKYLHRAK